MASSTEYMYKINKFTSEIDTLTNKLIGLNKTSDEYPDSKGKLAFKFRKVFGKEIGKLPYLKFSVISNLENSLRSDKQVESVTKTELNKEIKILTKKCRTFNNILVDRKR